MWVVWTGTFLWGSCGDSLCPDCTEGLSCLLVSGLLLCPLLLTRPIRIITRAALCFPGPRLFSSSHSQPLRPTISFITIWQVHYCWINIWVSGVTRISPLPPTWAWSGWYHPVTRAGAPVPGAGSGLEGLSQMLRCEVTREPCPMWRPESLTCLLFVFSGAPRPTQTAPFSPPGMYLGFLIDFPTSSLGALESISWEKPERFLVNVLLKYTTYIQRDMYLKCTAWWVFTNRRQPQEQCPEEEIRSHQPSRSFPLFLPSQYSPPEVTTIVTLG